jgi:hypothetical protein
MIVWRNHKFEIWGFHSSAVQDLSIMECYAMSLGQQIPGFSRTVQPSSAQSRSQRRVLRNIKNYSLTDTASLSGRLEFLKSQVL